MPIRKYDAIIVHTDQDATVHYPNGVFVYRDLKEAFADQAKVTIEIKSRRKPRSLKQNDFYWGYFLQFEIDCFLEFWGELYDKKQMHDWNKSEFFGEVRAIESTGEVVRLPGSSKELSTIDFELKLDDIRQWFRLNFEFEIPYPNEQGEIDLK